MKTRKRKRWGNKNGYSLIEVGIAVIVLGLTAASSMMAMRIGFSLIESARDNTLASQILQSEMENLRLKSWEQLTDLTDGEFQLEEAFSDTMASRFTGTRSISQPATGMRIITLEVDWTSSRGRPMNRQYMSFFSKSGLNDYYYRAF